MRHRLTQGLARLVNAVRHRRAFSARRYSPGRRLLLAGVPLAGAGLAWMGWRRRTVYDLESVVTATCDRLLPARGEHPGAVALGIHRLVIDELRATRGDDYLASLVALLRDHDFLDLSSEAQDDAISRFLDRGRDRATALMFGNLLHRSVHHYLAHPGAWPALGYARPQPLGYPDYASCPMERST